MTEIDGGISLTKNRKGPIDKIWAFLEDCLIGFREKPFQERAEVEEDISDLLSDEFAERGKNENMFFITPQRREKIGSKFKPDFTVKLCSDISFVLDGIQYYGRDSIVKIEAKRLDSNLGPKRDKEYVIGNGLENGKTLGGIERYKNESHGADVLYCGMIGYLQSNNFRYWETKVNSIIQDQCVQSSDPELNWTEEDKLVPVHQNEFVHTFSSFHYRKTKLPIRFRHLWVDLRKA